MPAIKAASGNVNCDTSLPKYAFDASPLQSYSELATSAVNVPWLPHRQGWSATRRTSVEGALRGMWDLDSRIFTADPPGGATPGDDN